jgi:hypothetical protein
MSDEEQGPPEQAPAQDTTPATPTEPPPLPKLEIELKLRGGDPGGSKRTFRSSDE